ncbi:MAG TPA: PAS domain-containing protein, partial [Gemmataceae bacterium]
MSDPNLREELLLRELEELRRQLEEPEELLRALRHGEVDAFVVPEPDGERIYALRSADALYRVMIEQMKQGAVTLSADGTIIYCNYYFAELLRVPRERLLGSAIRPHIAPASRPLLDAWVGGAAGPGEGLRAEAALTAGDGTEVPVYLALSVLPVEGVKSFCLVVTDLTEQKRQQEVLEQAGVVRSILEQAAEAILVCDGSGTVTHASRAAAELCGGNPILRPFGEAFPLRHRTPAGPGEPFTLGPVLGGRTL